MLLILNKPLKEGFPPLPHPKVVVTEESRTPRCKNETFRVDSFIMLLTLANIRSFFISGIKVGSSLLSLNGEKMKWKYQIILQNYYYCYFYPENSYSYRWTQWFPFCDFLCKCGCCLSLKSNCGLRNALLKETNMKISESVTTTRLPLVTVPVPAYWTLKFLFTIYAFTLDYQYSMEKGLLGRLQISSIVLWFHRTRKIPCAI